MRTDKQFFKWYNIIGLLIAFIFYFMNKTLDAIWIMAILIHSNQTFNQNK